MTAQDARSSSDKREATLRARAALLGIVLHSQHDDRGRPEWIATRWCFTRPFSSLDELATWLEQEGAC